MTIKDIREGLNKNDFSVVEITNFFIDKIKKDKSGSFITISEKLALELANNSDKDISLGIKKDLLGIPFGIKDNIAVKNVLYTAGSKMLENHKSCYDAEVIEKLKKNGSVILGKLNMDEFAMGSSNESSFFGNVSNPHDPERVAGGSSGGSAASVALGLSVFSLGSDTGGSIRQPASFCGVVGLKPTYGSVSRRGLISLASSLDQIGSLTKNIDDSISVFKVISGRDPLDSTSKETDKKIKEIDFSKIKIGVPKEYFIDGIDPRIEKMIKDCIDKLYKKGIEIKEISLPHTKYALPVYYIIMSSEASTNLSRYDGLRYGFNKKEKKDIIDCYFNNRGDGFGLEVKRRIILGTYCLSSGYKDAYYNKAMKIRNLIENDFNDAFKEVDIIISPTCPELPFKIGEKNINPVSMYLSDILTVTANLSGIPAISMPCGKINNLPVGIQLMGNKFEDLKMLEIAKYFEKIWK